MLQSVASLLPQGSSIGGAPSTGTSLVINGDSHHDLREALLHNTKIDDDGREGMLWSMDWMGRPADHRQGLGGWRCALCVLGTFGLLYSAFYGILANLVLYLVGVWGQTNAAAANSVTTLMGSSLLFSVFGAFSSDAYLGRLWGSILFSIVSFISFVLCGLVTSTTSETFLLCSLYLMGLASGSSFPNLTSLGADQLATHTNRARYFTLVATMVSVGQIFATTAVTYVDSRGLWGWGFWMCAMVAGAGLALHLGAAHLYLQTRPRGNPLTRVAQVFVGAIHRRHVTPSLHPSSLHELSSPGHPQLPHTPSLRFLDKAATIRPGESSQGRSPWALCTVTQVEEVKGLLRVIPVGLASTCVAAMAAQVNTLFEEQAALTHTEVATWLSIAPASMHVFSIAGSILTGAVHTTLWQRATCLWGKGAGGLSSLRVQGTAMVVSLGTMAVAALVEAYRLHAAHAGSVISILWLVPQNFLLGVATNLIYSGSMEFFYNEVSDGIRAISSSISLLFLGVGNYLSTMLVLLVNYFSSRGSHQAWIPSNLNDGHLDYFYWFLASFLGITLCLYLGYTHSYSYRQRFQNIDNNSINTFIMVE